LIKCLLTEHNSARQNGHIIVDEMSVDKKVERPVYGPKTVDKKPPGSNNLNCSLTSTFYDPNIFLRNLFSLLNLCSSLKARDYDPQPYKTIEGAYCFHQSP
jgi:hypothetical protein